MQYLKAEVRTRIIEAAKTEFLNNGYFDASIRNIAQMSDVSLGNIYRYFTDKEALFIAVCDDMLQSAVTLIEDSFYLTPVALTDFANGIVDFVGQYADEITILFKSADSYKQYFNLTLTNALCGKLTSLLQDTTKLGTELYPVICANFLQGIVAIVRVAQADMSNHIKQLTGFYFNDIANRYNNF